MTRRRARIRLAVPLAAVTVCAALQQLSASDFPGRLGTAGAAALAATDRFQESIRWWPERIVEGTLFTVIIESATPDSLRVSGSFAGEPLHFTVAGRDRLVALAAAPLDSTGRVKLTLDLTRPDGLTQSRVLDVPIDSGAYRLERLRVAPEFGRPQPAEIQRRIAAEVARARTVSSASHSTPRLWELPFAPPRPSPITSGFGHGRTFNGAVQSRHTGTDYGGAVGAPVHAPARGVVALVDEFYLGGRVLYIDHGAGLVTGYLHLLAHEVAQGDTVQPGQLIGRVGASGRVTGPHLHWIVRYGQHAVSGLSLLTMKSDSQGASRNRP